MEPFGALLGQVDTQTANTQALYLMQGQAKDSAANMQAKDFNTAMQQNALMTQIQAGAYAQQLKNANTKTHEAYQQGIEGVRSTSEQFVFVCALAPKRDLFSMF